MTSDWSLRPCAAALALALGACASTYSIPAAGRLVSLGASPGYNADAHTDSVIAEGLFYTDYAAVFGADFTEDSGVFPVAIRMGYQRKGAGDVLVQFQPTQADLTLFLEDGTALRAVTVDEVAASNKKVASIRDKCLQSGTLTSWDAAQGQLARFVFFRIEPAKAFEFEGGKLIHRVGGTERALDVSHSVISFNLIQNDALVPFSLGLKAATLGKKP